ncbi:hypothetical protein LTR62_006005 [Meristemomyces frigidus]|uniref:Ribosome biogenesis protein NOP53 n=1 Tax=Meristemomyces frigidus TaxID=1508187 RepID=A0AAN7TN18_9PEZI|nr:hypothetical protein LTR62_006005 [Meristemomyces frigidus]
MATTAVKAPATHTQPSRKGKKAWRKNVDISEIQTGLENVREEIIKTGGVIAEKPSDALFATDLLGDSKIAKKQSSRRLLKSEEILAQRSAVPGFDGRKRKADPLAAPSTSKKQKTKDYVTHKDLQRLKHIADYGEVGLKIEDTVAHDPWEAVVVEKDERLNYLEDVPATKEPKTLKQAPIPLSATGRPVPAVRKPAAGKSYNPLVEDWSLLLSTEGSAAVEAEKSRLASEAEIAARDARAEAEAALVEKTERDDYGTDYESAWESEWDGFQSGAEGEGDVHVAKMVKRKTPAERNKIKARKEREAREKWEKKQKERDGQERRIKEIARAMSKRDKARKAAGGTVAAADEPVFDSSDDGQALPLQRRRFGKLPIPEAPLEIVLPDELEDSLRRLKPEGSLLTDRYRNYLLSGKVEVRKKHWQYRQAKTERTEKWTYKDWTLK